LSFEGVTQNETELILPHPKIIERSFVLLPLLEIAPDFCLPNLGELKAYLPKVVHQRIEKLPAATAIAGKKTFIAKRRINSLNSRHGLLTGRQANHNY
jgi:2-amino-4-hydroxy-6-hydroxymethyldihydropteridine diphosphokinase